MVQPSGVGSEGSTRALLSCRGCEVRDVGGQPHKVPECCEGLWSRQGCSLGNGSRSFAACRPVRIQLAELWAMQTRSVFSVKGASWPRGQGSRGTWCGACDLVICPGEGGLHRCGLGELERLWPGLHPGPWRDSGLSFCFRATPGCPVTPGGLRGP